MADKVPGFSETGTCSLFNDEVKLLFPGCTILILVDDVPQCLSVHLYVEILI